MALTSFSAGNHPLYHHNLINLCGMTWIFPSIVHSTCGFALNFHHNIIDRKKSFLVSLFFHVKLHRNNVPIDNKSMVVCVRVTEISNDLMQWSLTLLEVPNPPVSYEHSPHPEWAYDLYEVYVYYW